MVKALIPTIHKAMQHQPKMKLKSQKPISKGYDILIKGIGSILEQGRKQAYRAIDTILVKTYWEIGKQVIVYEQEGREKKYLLDVLLVYGCK